MKKYADLTVEEKNDTILMLVDYIIKTKCSIRKATDYAKKQEIQLSYVTLHNVIYNKLPEIDEEKYSNVIKIIEANKPKTLDDVKVKARIYEAVSLLLQDFTIPEIAEKLNSTYDTIYDDLNNRYSKLEPDKIEEVKQKLEDHRLANLHQNRINNTKEISQNLVGKGVRKSTHIPEANQKTQNVNRTDITKVSLKQIEEYIHIALTYRVSYKNMEDLLQTSEENIKKSFARLNEYSKALYYLDLETRNEDEIGKKISYYQAYNYLVNRKGIVKKLDQAKREQNKELIESLRIKLKEHTSLIDDSVVLGTFNKPLAKLTKNELEALARYRLKYYISLRKIGSILRRSRETIQKLEESLSESDKIFNRKIERLNDVYNEALHAIKTKYGKKLR